MTNLIIKFIFFVYISFLPQYVYSSYKNQDPDISPHHTTKGWEPPYRDSRKIHSYRKSDTEKHKDIYEPFSKSVPDKSQQTYFQHSIPAKNNATDKDIVPFR